MNITLRCTGLAAALLAGLPAASHAQCEPRFIVDGSQGYAATPDMFLTSDAGTDYISRATTWDPDGDGPVEPWLVLTGRFARAGNTSSASIVAWDGQQWHDFGRGMSVSPVPSPPRASDVGTVQAVGTFGGKLVVAGGTGVSAVGYWNGSQWPRLGSGGPAGIIRDGDIAEHAGSLFVAGISQFLDSNNVMQGPSIVVKVLDEDFAAVGLRANSSVLTRRLISRPEGLYAVGSFTSVGTGASTVALNNVALWNGDAWSSVGGGTNAECSDAAFIDGQLHVVGSFTQAGGVPASRVTRWDGVQWRQVGDGSLTSATAILAFNGELYVGGATATQSGVFKLDEGSWTFVGGFQPMRMIEYRGELVAMGNTTAATDQGVTFAVSDVARLTSDGWRSIGAPNTYEVFVNEVSWQGRAIASAGASRDSSRSLISEWNGSTWVPFPPLPDNAQAQLFSVNDRLFALTPGADRVFTLNEFVDGAWIAGAHFSTAPDVFSSPVIRNLVELNGDIFAIGIFSFVDGVATRGVARLRGGTWSPIEIGINALNALDSQRLGDRIFLTGQFSQDGLPAFSLASFDGATLTPYVGTSPALMYQLSSDGTDLFGSNGTIYRWNGSAWIEFGSVVQLGTSARTDAPFRVGQSLWSIVRSSLPYSFADGFSYLARWSDTGELEFLSPPFGHLPGRSYANATYSQAVAVGDEIHVFGDFDQIGSFLVPGNNVVKNWTRFTTNGIPLIVTQPADAIASCGDPVSLHASVANGYDADGALQYQWYRDGQPLTETQFVRGVNTDTLTIPALQQPFTGFYSLTVTNSCGTTTSREALVSGDSPDCRACAPCAADFDLDGGVTGADASAFFASYQIGAACADINADGGVTGDDLAAFFLAYEAGGC